MNRKSIKEKADSCEPSGHTGAQYNDGPSGKNNGGQLGLWAVAANTKFVFGFMVITTVTIGCIYSVVYTTVLPSIGRLEALENRVKELETAINQCNINCLNVAIKQTECNNNCPDVRGIQNDIDKIRENFNKYVDKTTKDMHDLKEKIPIVSPGGAEINENAILDKIKDPVSMMITTQTNAIKVKLDNNTARIERVHHDLAEVDNSLAVKVSYWYRHSMQLQKKLTSLNKSTEKLQGNISVQQKNISEINNTQNRITDFIKRFGDKIWAEVDGTSLNNLEKIDEVNGNLTEKIDVLSARIEKVNDTVVDVNRTLSSDLLEIKSTQNKITDFIRRFGDKMWDEVDSTSLRLNSLEMASSNQIWYNILGHCFVLVIGILIFLVLGNQKPDQVSSVGVIGASSRRDVPQKSLTIRNVLDEIQRRPLEKRLCIISFYAETQNLHKCLTDSACGGTGIDQQAVLIARHENIPNLPPCQIFLVFVDFNERDIILENPKKEVGDLKLTTVKGARKMGGDVFVICVHDEGSKALESGHLFNPKLMSIHNHDELKDLNSRKRVLSTYEGFSQYQIEHLSTCLNVLQ